VVTNAIVLIDLVNQYRKQGLSVRDSLMNGARQRLRPILMTALATIFALTPMSLGLTGDSGFISQPLAIVVIGGLFSSTLLTLILVPTLYWLVEGRKERKRLRIERRDARKTKRAAKKAPAAVMTEVSEEQPQGDAPTAVITEVAETREDELADAIENTFAPAKPAVAPEMAWSDDAQVADLDMPLDDETQMKWSEEQSDQPPAKATSENVPEFLTSELPIVQQDAELTGKAKREAKKREKAEAKAQRKAAKNSRHSGN
jgi:HAE1 family hydrophobic/amphiphilic exporter-1